MQLEKLKNLILRSESESVEFKKTTGQRTEAAKTICALLNGLGGCLIFGVSDRGELIGQQVTNKTLEDLATELRRIEPPAFPEIKTIFIEGDRKIILIRVNGEQGTYTYDGRPYLRHGSTTQMMPRSEYERRLLDSMQHIDGKTGLFLKALPFTTLMKKKFIPLLRMRFKKDAWMSLHMPTSNLFCLA